MKKIITITRQTFGDSYVEVKEYKTFKEVKENFYKQFEKTMDEIKKYKYDTNDENDIEIEKKPLDYFITFGDYSIRIYYASDDYCFITDEMVEKIVNYARKEADCESWLCTLSLTELEKIIGYDFMYDYDAYEKLCDKLNAYEINGEPVFADVNEEDDENYFCEDELSLNLYGDFVEDAVYYDEFE